MSSSLVEKTKCLRNLTQNNNIRNKMKDIRNKYNNIKNKIKKLEEQMIS